MIEPTLSDNELIAKQIEIALRPQKNVLSHHEDENGVSRDQEFDDHDTRRSSIKNRESVGSFNGNHVSPPRVNIERHPSTATRSNKSTDSDDDEPVVLENETFIPTPPPVNGTMSVPVVDDDVDGRPQDHDGHPAELPVKDQAFGGMDYALCVISIIFFFFDAAINAYVAQKFEEIRHTGEAAYQIYFWLTTVFITLSAAMTVVFEIVWYSEEKKKYGHSLTWDQWIVRLIFIFMGLGPAFRYLELVLYAHKHQKKAKNLAEKAQVIQKAMMMKLDADFLYMLEKFTESGLHFVLQMYIVKVEVTEEESLIGAAECTKIIFAAILMPYTVTCFLRSERQAHVQTNNMSIVGAVIQYFSRFFIISSQAVVMAMFLASYPFIFMLITVCTWGLMAIWVFTQDTHFSSHTWVECVYRFLIAFIYLFNYVNVRSDPSYYRALFYYCFTFLEKGLMVCFWCQQETYKNWYRWPVLMAFFVFFIGGIAIKIIYYECHHPTRVPTINLKEAFALKRKSSQKSMNEIVDIPL